MAPGGGKRGFTLIEVLTALLILAIVLTTLFASYSMTLETVKDSESLSRIYETARVSLERMAEDLEAAYAPALKQGAAWTDEVFVGEEIIEEGRRADRLSFFSLSSACLEATGCRPVPSRIRYAARKDGEGLVLYRGESPLSGTGTEVMLPLARGLYSVEFSYHDHEGRTFRSWDSLSPPAMVTIVLTFPAEGDREEGLSFSTSAAVHGPRDRDEKSPAK